ncbi:uncharacterized protein LOC111051083 [Nilaparvata lugens]|uniref:uncharacterized protein LOC111051083 n=1 Tax=Nilaparvata lugens TaxID=108931 RepID=UPI00193DA830|nr:uncharacterized protein LOC111051083 [Nilaparvata lugens]
MLKTLSLILCLLTTATQISAATERFQDSDRYKDNEAEVFHHGQVQTSDTATIEELYKHGLLDKHRERPVHEAHGKPRPTKYPRPGLDGGLRGKYALGTPPNAHKITLMKTYYDPITNQPYMYVMRKRPSPHLQDTDDSFFSTASKLISTFLGPDEKYKPRMSSPGGRGMKMAGVVAPPKRVPRSLKSIADLHQQSFNSVDNVQRIRTLQELSQHQSYQSLHNKATTYNNQENEVDNEEEEVANSQTTNNEQVNHQDNSTDENNMSSLEESLKIVQRLVTKCGHNFLSPKDNATEIYNKIKGCVQRHVLKAFDRMLNSDYIPLSDGVILVRDKDFKISNYTGRSETMSESFIAAVSERMFTLLQSHSLQLRLWDSSQVEEGRRRHQYRKAFPMMVAGYMMLSAFLVPLGFQFMAMIGGKALLLSKMALMMSMLGGFKKLLSPDPIYHLPAAAPSFEHASLGWHRSTREPAITQAFAKTGGHGNSQWTDPKTYSLLR